MVDYIIVGAGSAGCVLANRLTENPAVSVLLLEAGGPDIAADISVPANWNTLLNTDVDWLYKTEPQAHLNNRSINWNRGKVLGGSSSINLMVYIRGNRLDYDRWEELGNVGWSYDDVLPYFIKSEHQERGTSDYHGVNGPMSVSDASYVSPIASLYRDALLELGYPETEDFNGAVQEGVGTYQFNIRDGKRESSATAFLEPIKHRANLKIQTNVHVTKVLVENNRAVGVEYVQNDQIKQVQADGEVLLTAGAINSPQILMCSGIGPAPHLQRLGIPIVADIPGVGQNLQDHIAMCLDYMYNEVWLKTSTAGNHTQEELEAHTGLSIAAFIKTRSELKRPDVQFGIYDVRTDGEFDCRICVNISRPYSRGYMTLRYNDPFEYPIIQPNYLQDERDLQPLIDSVRLTRQIVQSETMKKAIATETCPGFDVQSDSKIIEWIRNNTFTNWHFCGTCKMGIDSMSVVTPQLKVHGIEGLRVVDASIIPEIISGNTNAPIIMIAEKASALIKKHP